MQILTTNHWTEVGDPFRGIKGKIEGAEIFRGRFEGAEGDGDHIGRPGASTIPDPWGLIEVESPTREHTGAGLRLLLHI